MPRVLIVDDNETALRTMSAYLRLCGFETATAATGRAGVDLAAHTRFDVGLVDLHLPDMSGIDVVRAIWRGSPEVRLVLTTAFPTFDAPRDAAEAGAAVYVEGPLFGDDVVGVVLRALEPLPGGQALAEGTSARPTPDPPDPRPRRILKEIDAGLGQPTRARDVAAAVDLSESRIEHLSRRWFGVSLGVLTLERRLQVAAHRLRHTFTPIGLIAHSVGFGANALREFRRAFRRRFGMSPREYRRRFWHGPGT